MYWVNSPYSRLYEMSIFSTNLSTKVLVVLRKNYLYRHWKEIQQTSFDSFRGGPWFWRKFENWPKWRLCYTLSRRCPLFNAWQWKQDYSDGHDCFWTIYWCSNEFFNIWYQACFYFWSYPSCIVLHDDMCVVLKPWINNSVRIFPSLWFSSFVKRL